MLISVLINRKQVILESATNHCQQNEDGSGGVCLTDISMQVVEMASMAAVESGIGRLQCVNSTIDLIQAQAKEARVTLHQYQDQGDIVLCIRCKSSY